MFVLRASYSPCSYPLVVTRDVLRALTTRDVIDQVKYSTTENSHFKNMSTVIIGLILKENLENICFAGNMIDNT